LLRKSDIDFRQWDTDDAAYKDAQARAHLDEGAAKRSALNRVEQGSGPGQRA
jgi:hypothetical protein